MTSQYRRQMGWPSRQNYTTPGAITQGQSAVKLTPEDIPAVPKSVFGNIQTNKSA